MVVLRLTRIGKKKHAQYRVVVADSKRFINSKNIAIVGWYNPHTKECELKKDQIASWLEKGAQPSNTVAKILAANGVKLPDWVKITERVSKPKKEPIVKPEKPAAVEVPAEENTTETAQAEDVPSESTTEEVNAEEEQIEEAEEIETEAEEAASEEAQA